MDDPEGFLQGLRGKRLVIDEIHRLGNPSELLKIAADHYRDIRIIATGSSTLAATSKFSDTLAGRKEEIWLTPIMSADLVDFRCFSLQERFLKGGLPPFYLEQEIVERDYQEWMDAYWARDIQSLFRLERRFSFQRLTELLMAQSGGMFEATAFAAPCEVSRGTIHNYLTVLETTHLAHVVRPFNSRKATEIVSSPKVYMFDTGFICYHKGWNALRNEDLGLLWEHYVLNEIHARLHTTVVLYWRDKRGHEVAFILVRRGRAPLAVECKWSSAAFDTGSLEAFARQYPEAELAVVAPDVERPLTRQVKSVALHYMSLEGLMAKASGWQQA